MSAGLQRGRTLGARPGMDLYATRNANSWRLREAASTGNLATVAKEIDSGVDIDGPDASGRTALHKAAGRGRAEVV